MKTMSLIVGFVLLLLTLIFLSCARRTEERIPSPNGKLVLAPMVDKNADVVIRILDKAGGVVFSETTFASDSQNWSMTWATDRKVVLRSSDCGTFEWVCDEAGRWELVDEGFGNTKLQETKQVIHGDKITHQIQKYFDGSLFSEGLLRNGKRHGKWIWWNKDGSIRQVRYYIDGEDVTKKGESHVGEDIWKQMTPTGKHLGLE